MKIAIVSEWFSENMGYSENCLPKALASLGHDVHLVTSDLQIYYNSLTYKETYEPFIGPAVVPCGVKKLDGFTLHRLSHARWFEQRWIQGLSKKLAEIRPQILQTLDSSRPETVEASLAKIRLSCKLFLESHIHASVFFVGQQELRFSARLKQFALKNMFGPLVSSLSEKCYPISIDAAEIAVKHFGIQERKIKVCSLGVDTDLFKPALDSASQKERTKLRQQLGFSSSDVVCIYTGRFSGDKGPLCLAQAIDSLVKNGESFRGLFVGNGTEADVADIHACSGCVIHPFVPARELPLFYRAADVGVWPRQESTSQLDAVACGLPIILSNRVSVNERVEGNGLIYEEDNALNLARKIKSLAEPSLRASMGQIGIRKIEQRFSWKHIAKERVQDYEASLKH